MLVKAPSRFTSAVQARDHLALYVHHLTRGVDAQASARIVHERRGPGGVERRLLDLVLGSGLAKIHICTGVHKAVVSRHGRVQDGAAHRCGLIGIVNSAGEFFQRVSAEAIAVRIHIRRRDVPLLPCRRVGIEDGPDGARRVVGWRRRRIPLN